MQNDKGEVVDIYVPRKCSASNRLISAKDHASIQLNIGDVDENGIYTKSCKSYVISGFVRAMGESDDAINRLATQDVFGVTKKCDPGAMYNNDARKTDDLLNQRLSSNKFNAERIPSPLERKPTVPPTNFYSGKKYGRNNETAQRQETQFYGLRNIVEPLTNEPITISDEPKRIKIRTLKISEGVEPFATESLTLFMPDPENKLSLEVRKSDTEYFVLRLVMTVIKRRIFFTFYGEWCIYIELLTVPNEWKTYMKGKFILLVLDDSERLAKDAWLRELCEMGNPNECTSIMKKFEMRITERDRQRETAKQRAERYSERNQRLGKVLLFEEAAVPAKRTRSSLRYDAQSTGGVVFLGNSDSKPIFIYPPTDPQGVTVYSDDIGRLDDGQFLSDALIMFYLRYLLEDTFPSSRHRFHLFNTFFYTHLATCIIESNSNDFHLLLGKWTKGVNIFGKDFVIIPVHQSMHWMLVVICHPSRCLNNVETSDIEMESFQGSPVLGEDFPIHDLPGPDSPIQKSPILGQPLALLSCYDNSPPLEEAKLPLACVLDEKLEDTKSNWKKLKSDEKKLKSDDDVIHVEAPQKKTLILVFDSMSSAFKKDKLIRNLKSLLKSEAKQKLQSDINEKLIFGHSAKVPQQDNTYDCGVFALQYAEMFIEKCDKIAKSFDDVCYAPKTAPPLSSWFNPLLIKKKRKEIQDLVIRKMGESNHQVEIIGDDDDDVVIVN